MSTATSTPTEAETTAEVGRNKYIVKYRHSYYDITEFMHKHPGGLNTLKGLSDADMTGRFQKAPPHSDAAMYLMKEYKLVDEDAAFLSSSSSSRRRNSDSSEANAPMETLKRQREDRSNNNLDESLEHLVDWSKPMFSQIPNITKYYDEWVHKPVDRPLRLFGPWYLEMCTKTPWWVVPLFWIPVITTITATEFSASARSINQSLLLCSYFVIGIIIWTLIEYSLHRWVFHMKVNVHSSALLCSFHFLIHGLHHKVPFDAMRLVFPPLPGVILATTLYTPFSFVLPQPRAFLAGALFGYLCYDMMHYYLHYGDPTLKHLYHMKRYHYQHHFAHQDLGYGISSPLWDLVFRTRISLRKLRYRLRWS